MKECLLKTDRTRVLSQSVVDAATRLKISSTDLEKILGLSQSASSRLFNHEHFIQEATEEWKRSTYFLRLYCSFLTLVDEDNEFAIDWMTSKNKTFNHKMPIRYQGD